MKQILTYSHNTYKIAIPEVNVIGIMSNYVGRALDSSNLHLVTS